MPVLSPCAQVIFRYFLLEAVGSAKRLYFLNSCMDLSEILEVSPKMNVLLAIYCNMSKVARTEQSKTA